MIRYFRHIFFITVALLFVGCGKPTASQEDGLMVTNIVGGQLSTAEFQRANGIVGVFIEYTDGKSGLCTGTLIARRWVLTAAHCGSRNNTRDMYAVFGTNINDQSKIKVQSRRNHGGYDLALLQLSADAPRQFSLARIPALNVTDQMQGRQVVIAGFGKSNATYRDGSSGDSGAGRLRHVQMTVDGVDSQTTELILEDPTWRLFTQYNSACGGDSGGPAFLRQRSGSLIQVGVAARTAISNRGQCNQGISYYISISAHLNWIRTQLGLRQ